VTHLKECFRKTRETGFNLTERIYNQMALAPLDFLTAVKAVDIPLLGAHSLAPETSAGSHPLFAVVLTD
jgi:hypothetical protein